MRSASTIGALAGLVLGACAKAPPAAGPADGAALFREQNCVQCHGADGSGTNLGPTLRQKKQFWTRERLAAYLADPQRVIDADERLKLQAAKYMLPMIPFANLSAEQRLALADHVLGLP